ncbi:MAG: hypothetical protein JWL92_182 [Candidatus Nomurabacteria bacterium]|nr:hypothetical protein [Candidatus Nomurabacteria bacterium]
MTTRYLQLSQQNATGVVLTDSSLRFVALSTNHGTAIPGQYAELSVPEGCLKDGVIASKSRFVSFLKTLKKTYKIDSINLVLNSEQIKTASISLKTGADLQINEAVEKLFSIPAKDVVYEYKVIGGDSDTTVLQVTGLVKKVSEDFVWAFKQAGITVLSIEPLGHALARDVLPIGSNGTALVLAIDTRNTTLTYVVNGRVSETTILDFSDLAVTDTIMQHLSITAEEADKAKQEQGLIIRHSRTVFDAIADECALFVKHVNHSYITWKTAHPALPAIEGIYLTGAGSTIKGLDDYLSAGLRVPVKVANVWANCLSFDDHIPAMPQTVAVRYGAAIGTALMGPHMVNLVPDAHQRSLYRKHVAKRSGKVLLSFIFGVLVGALITWIIAIPAVHSKIFEVLHKIPTQW